MESSLFDVVDERRSEDFYIYLLIIKKMTNYNPSLSNRSLDLGVCLHVYTFLNALILYTVRTRTNVL